MPEPDSVAAAFATVAPVYPADWPGRPLAFDPHDFDRSAPMGFGFGGASIVTPYGTSPAGHYDFASAGQLLS